MKTLALFTLLFCILPAATDASGRTKFRLAYQPTAAPVTLESRSIATTTVTTAGGTVSSTTRSRKRTLQEVVARGDALEIRLTSRLARLSIDGVDVTARRSSAPGDTARFLLTPRGTPVAGAGEMGLVLPPGPVGIGDSWEHITPAAGATPDIRTRCTLTGTATVAGRRCAIILAEGRGEGVDARSGTRVVYHDRTMALLDPDQGRLLRSRSRSRATLCYPQPNRYGYRSSVTEVSSTVVESAHREADRGRRVGVPR